MYLCVLVAIERTYETQGKKHIRMEARFNHGIFALNTQYAHCFHGHLVCVTLFVHECFFTIYTYTLTGFMETLHKSFIFNLFYIRDHH